MLTLSFPCPAAGYMIRFLKHIYAIKASTFSVSSFACITLPYVPVKISSSLSQHQILFESVVERVSGTNCSQVFVKKVRLYGRSEVDLRKFDTSSLLQYVCNLVTSSVQCPEMVVLCVVVVEGLVAYGTFIDHNILPHRTSSFVLMPLSLRPVLELCPTSIFTEIPLCPAFPILMLSKKMTSKFFFVYCMVFAFVHCTWVRPWCHGFSAVGVLNVLSKSFCGTCLSFCFATINLAIVLWRQKAL